MKTYRKTIDGKRVCKARNQIVIIKDGRQYINPTHEMLIADGWEEYIAPVVEEIPEDVVVEDNIVEEETYSPIDNTIEIPVPEVSDKMSFVRARHKLRNAIRSYDMSSEVNIFYVNEIPMWLDKATRTGLMLRFQSEISLGDVETTLWYGSQKFVLPINTAQTMLHRIEKYASQCYDNTQMHLANINTLETIEDIQNYDYKSGYPERLKF